MRLRAAASRSADPFDQPRIAPTHFAEEIDRKPSVEGFRTLRKSFRRPASRGLCDEEVLPGRPLRMRGVFGVQTLSCGG